MINAEVNNTAVNAGEHKIVGSVGGLLALCSCSQAVDDFEVHLAEVKTVNTENEATYTGSPLITNNNIHVKHRMTHSQYLWGNIIYMAAIFGTIATIVVIAANK